MIKIEIRVNSEANNAHSGNQLTSRPGVDFWLCHLLTSNNGIKLSGTMQELNNIMNELYCFTDNFMF